MNIVWRIVQTGLEYVTVAGYVYAVCVLLLLREFVPLCLLSLAGSAGWGCLAAYRLHRGTVWFSLVVLVPSLLAVLALGMSALALVSLLEWASHSFLGVLS